LYTRTLMYAYLSISIYDCMLYTYMYIYVYEYMYICIYIYIYIKQGYQHEPSVIWELLDEIDG
jgi:hypothetical protein